MPTKAKRAPANPARPEAERAIEDQVQVLLTALERLGTKRIREEMMPRYGIHTKKAFGVSMANLKILAKRHGRNHELAAALWDTGWYEARMVAALVDEPERVTSAQMDRWVRDFDNWGICDTVCFCLFDRTPHGFSKVAQWSSRRDEFEKRAAFALLASLALHDKGTDDEPFARGLPLIESAANDERNFVKKSVNWALRAIGGHRVELHAAAVTLAQRLAGSADAAPRWIGKDALRELTGPVVARRLAARRRAAAEKSKRGLAK